jgi:hypothetical protein
MSLLGVTKAREYAQKTEEFRKGRFQFIVAIK